MQKYLRKLKTPLLQTIKAFTLMEIFVVVIIIAIIATFGIPNYIKAVEKTYERNAVSNLKVIRVAAEIYEDQTGGTLGSWIGLDAVNTALGLSIVDPSLSYRCQTVASRTNECWAEHSSGWRVHFHEEDSNGLIHCWSNFVACPTCIPCPSCPPTPGNCE